VSLVQSFRSGWVVPVLLSTLLGVGDSACGSRGGRVVIALRSSIGTLDPHAHDELMAWSLLSNFYDALVRFSPTMELQPSLATSWEQVDARTVRFHLRRGVRFHDGTPFTAEDVAASFRRAVGHPSGRLRHYLVGIEEVRAEGEDSVLVKSAAASPTLVHRLCFLFIVPKSEETVPEIREPIGTGPYRFAGRDKHGGVRGVRTATWHERPAIRLVEFVGIDDESERTRSFTTGQVDVAVALPDRLVGEVGRSPGKRLVVQPIMGVRLLAIMPGAAVGAARAALSDVRVRRAMLAAIDRERMANVVYSGNATVATQYVHPVVFGYDPALRPVPYDPVQARRLLVEAGFGQGFDVELGHGHIAQEVVGQLVENLGAIGIRVHPRGMAFPALQARAAAGGLPLMIYSRSCMSGDASDFLNSTIHTPDPARGFGGENFHGFSDPVADGLIESAELEADREQRLRLLQHAQRRALEGLPVLPLVVQWEHLGVSEGLEVVIRHDGWLWCAAFRWAR
jgi:peptide/nickel transport system substrate-binding protein